MDDIIKHIEHDGDLINFSINTNHKVFTGHFPEYPILPGVFEMYIIHKIIEYKLTFSINLVSVEIVKFLIPILPSENKTFSFYIKSYETSKNNIKIDCQIMNEGKTICSFLGIFNKI